MLGGLLIAVPPRQVVVEVLPLRTHATDVQGEDWFGLEPRPVDVVGHRGKHRGRDVEALCLLRFAGRRKPFLEQRPVDAVGLLRRIEDRQPPVGDLRGESNVVRADCREVDGEVGVLWPQHQLERLAQAKCTFAPVGKLVVITIEAHRPVAGQRHADDRDVLAGYAERLSIGPAVPTLDHLRPRDTEAEEKAATGHHIERCCGHRRHCRGASGHLQDAGAELDLFGASGQEGQRRQSVRAVRLCGPHRVVAEGFGLGDEAGVVGNRRCEVAEVDTEAHTERVNQSRVPIPKSGVRLLPQDSFSVTPDPYGP